MDTGSDYGPQYLLDTFSVRPLGGPEMQPAEAARVLFMPSFHPECCVTATLDGREPQVALVTMQTSLWKWYRTLRAEDDRSTEQGLPRVPERWEERAGIPADRLTVARNEILATEPLNLSDTHRIALDGMSVQGEYRSGDGRTIAFDDWVHPDRGRHYRFVLAVYRLAVDLLRDERSIRVLEKIHGYLGLGLPLKCTPGDPLVIRIFGRLTSSDKEPLGDALRRVPLDSPVLMDLSNLEGIARAVCPSFRHLLGRPGPIAWWAPGWLREQLPTVGIPAAQIFTRRLDAVNALRPPRFTRVAPDHSPPAELRSAAGNLLRYGRVAAKRQGTEAFRTWREDDGLWIAVFGRGLLASGVPAFAAIAGCLIGLAVFLMIRVGSPVHYTGVFLGLLGFLVIAIGGVADGYDQAFRQFEFHVSQAELVVCSFGPFGFRTTRWPRAAIKEVTISLDRLELVFRNRKSRVLLDRRVAPPAPWAPGWRSNSMYRFAMTCSDPASQNIRPICRATT